MAESFLSYFSCLVLDTGGFKQLSPREIFTIDIVTFLFAVGTVAMVTIPQPQQKKGNHHLWQE